MTSEISMTELFNAINECEYIQKSKSNKKKDKESLSYLIDIDLSQSDCIKMGIAIEKITKDIVLKNKNLVDIKPKNIKGGKEKDHLFVDEKSKIIYYAEFKTNLNLDTEKSKSTCKKCQDIIKELEIEYKDYHIKWCLLGCRYVNRIDIPKTIIMKYNTIYDNVYGINDYFEMLKIDFKFDEILYKDFINKIALEMLKDK